MICLLLIMTMIFINSTARAEQKIRHLDTLLTEEDMNAKTKAWLLMVESGKVDQEELRRITPKSIFIAPLLTSRIGKCKEGYRHDHLGQCVKVIKIDPKVQLELLLQQLNKLYGEKKEEKGEEAEFVEVSNGPLHISLPISVDGEKVNKTNNDTKLENQRNSTINNTIKTFSSTSAENVSEFIPIPLPMVYLNQTESNQTKEIESSGVEPLNYAEQYGTPQIEESGDGQTASGDDFLEEERTTESPVSLISEESDYFDVRETNSTAIENQSTTELPTEEITRSEGTSDVFKEESYQNKTFYVNDSTPVLSKENVHVQKEITVKSNPKSDKIHFPSDDNDGNYYNGLRTPISVFESSRIRFPDEVSQSQVTSYRSQPDFNTKITNYRSHSSVVPPEQFWWLPKNWQIDQQQQKTSALMKVWSRLPLLQDITYFQKTPDDLKKSAFLNDHQPQSFTPQYRSEEYSENPNRQRQPQNKIVKPIRNNRFQEVILTPRQNFRVQR